MHIILLAHIQTNSSQLQRSLFEGKSLHADMCEHLQSPRYLFSHEKMQREGYGGSLKPNVKVTVSKTQITVC